MEKKDWHSTEIIDVLEALDSSHNGISKQEALTRLQEYGPNELKEEKKKQWYHLLWEQFTSILVIVLIISAAISGYLALQEGEAMTDMYVILLIVVMNGILGFVQEYRAEQAVEALKAMVSPHVLVLRESKEE